MKMLAGKWKFAALGILTARVLAGLLVIVVAGCESGPSMEQLAPKIPKLKAEVPDSSHPEIPKDQFPNINNAPDRPSVMRSEAELGAIEDSLENAGQTHVKEAVGRITGEEPKDDGKGEADNSAAGAPAAPAQSGQPVQLSPTE